MIRYKAPVLPYVSGINSFFGCVAVETIPDYRNYGVEGLEIAPGICLDYPVHCVECGHKTDPDAVAALLQSALPLCGICRLKHLDSPSLCEFSFCFRCGTETYVEADGVCNCCKALEWMKRNAN